MGPKKESKKDAKSAAAAAMMKSSGPPKPKKIPPPPACFTAEDLAKYKEIFKEHDEENTEQLPLAVIPLMLRKLGFNPKGYEVKELFNKILEDDLVDTVEYHEWLFIIEGKMGMPDDYEIKVTEAMGILGHDEEKTGICDLDLLRTELFEWGEVLQDIEFVDWLKLAMKDKTYNPETGGFNYVKFIENMNAKDVRMFKEPINFFKLDQKTLAAMALAKAAEEREEQEKKEAAQRAREEARRQKMIADGLLPPD